MSNFSIYKNIVSILLCLMILYFGLNLGYLSTIGPFSLGHTIIPGLMIILIAVVYANTLSQYWWMALIGVGVYISFNFVSLFDYEYNFMYSSLMILVSFSLIFAYIFSRKDIITIVVPLLSAFLILDGVYKILNPLWTPLISIYFFLGLAIFGGVISYYMIYRGRTDNNASFT